MNLSYEHKRAEIEVYSKKAKGKPEWGSQWNQEAMNYLLRIGSEGTVENIFHNQMKASSCLIVGIGSGGDALRLKSICKSIVGIDIAKLQLSKASNSKPNNCELLLCDAEKLPFRHDAFTSIVCRATLHHLPNTIIALDEMSRVLKRGGTVVLHEPCLLNPIAVVGRRFFPTNMHTPGEKPFIPSYIKGLLGKKFQIIEMSYNYFMSPILPIILKQYQNIPNKVMKKVLYYAYHFDNFVLKSPLKQLCWSIILVTRKKKFHLPLE